MSVWEYLKCRTTVGYKTDQKFQLKTNMGFSNEARIAMDFAEFAKFGN